MYSLSQLRRGLRRGLSNPTLLAREVNRAYHRRLYTRRYNTAGVDVVAEDWDTLVVLDACRYDLFAERHTLPGDLSARVSRAAHTSEFLLGNFHERELLDTVYVTASPILQRGYDSKYRPTFHAVVNVWEEAGWDDESGTVLPETMVEYALEAARDYPQKRLVVHFMQPHYPFIGSELMTEEMSVPDPEQFTTDIWTELMTGRIRVPTDEVWRAYRDNLDRALPHVERLLGELSGKTVVTSDHGNMIGERARPIPIREWGHPPGVYTPELTRVPWLEHTAGPRRTIVAEEAEASEESSKNVTDDVVSDRLRHLGYA
jgi:hypothetical protein